MKVLLYSAKDFEIPFLERANKNRHKLTFCNESLSSESAMKSVGYDAISIFSSDDASLIVIEKLKDFGIKYITLRSVGYDNVNLKTAARLNIRVANVPGYSPNAVAEHAVALLLALNRKLIESHDRVRKFNFNLDNLIGFDLHNKTVGILGTGRIGSVMAKVMHGFGCKLLGFDRIVDQELIDNYNMTYLQLKELCKQSDIITIHLPLNGNTHYLINEDIVDVLKPGVVIINTARGAILNMDQIIIGLENGTISALGLDVYEHERHLFFKDSSNNIPFDDINILKLNAMPNVLMTGHHAFLTNEALTNIAKSTIDNLDCWEAGIFNNNDLV